MPPIKRLLMIFALLVLVAGGVVAALGERRLALWIGGAAGLALFMLSLFGKRGFAADLPAEAKDRWRSIDL